MKLPASDKIISHTARSSRRYSYTYSYMNKGITTGESEVNISTRWDKRRVLSIHRPPWNFTCKAKVHQVSASETRTVRSLEDGAHSSSVSVPIHKSRYSLQAFPRLINPGLFIYAAFVDPTKRHFLFVSKAFSPQPALFYVAEFYVLRSLYFPALEEKQCLVLEIKGSRGKKISIRRHIAWYRKYRKIGNWLDPYHWPWNLAWLWNLTNPRFLSFFKDWTMLDRIC